MKLALNSFSKLDGKKRYIVMGLLALELMSLPAAAKIIQTVSFDEKPLVTAVEIPTAQPGMSRFLVASNSGFNVKSLNYIGDVNTTIHVSGTLSGTTRFGDAAQLPGPKKTCAQSTGSRSAIYQADRETAAAKGTAPEQAVIFEFQYKPDSRPSFKFVTGDDNSTLSLECEITNT